MADVVNMNILSGIAGIVGAVTGVASLLEVRKLKSLDLRMESGRLLNTIQIGLDSLTELKEKANRSRINRLAAQGLAQSGSMQKWKEDFEKNKQIVHYLSEKFLALKNRKVSSKKLEAYILDLHLIEEQVKSMTSGFDVSLAEDGIARETLFRMKFETRAHGS
jgi:hypothetical protein